MPEYFDRQSYEDILARLLEYIPGDLSKVEGSVIRDALSPASFEFAQIYAEQAYAHDQSFVATASGDDLDKLTEQMGVSRLPATKAVREAHFYDSDNELMDIPLDSRFSCESENFAVQTRVNLGHYRLIAESEGAAGNEVSGNLVPADTYIPGYDHGYLEEVVIPGENVESDEALRERYIDLIGNEKQDGNVAQYVYWAETYPGIGRAKILPCWNGANTVKVSILDALNHIASDPLIQEFQAYLDPGSTGLGNGKAPIGALVTVTTAVALALDIEVSVTLVTGYTLEDTKQEIDEAVKAYLSAIAYEKSYINNIGMAATILTLDGVDAVHSLTINGTTANILLSDEQIGVLASLDVTGVTP